MSVHVRAVVQFPHAIIVASVPRAAPYALLALLEEESEVVYAVAAPLDKDGKPRVDLAVYVPAAPADDVDDHPVLADLDTLGTVMPGAAGMVLACVLNAKFAVAEVKRAVENAVAAFEQAAARMEEFVEQITEKMNNE